MSSPPPSRRHVVITGGTSGIGLAAAKAFANRGAFVTVTGATQDNVMKACDVLGDNGRAVRCDVRDVGALEAFAQSVRGSEHPVVDTLVLNAGAGTPMPLSLVNEAMFDNTVAVLMKGAFFSLQALTTLVRDGGNVLVTTSIVNQLAMPFMALYGACKAAQRSFVQAYALELAPRRVRVNSVSPGAVDTPFLARNGVPPEMVYALQDQQQQRCPLGRLASADEVAEVMCFLASEQAAYITGTELVMDGGMLLLRGDRLG